MTVFVKPSASVDLEHRAFYSAYGLHSGLLAFASAEGNVTIIGPDYTIQTTFQRPYKIKGIAVHPTLPLLGIVEGEDKHLLIVDIDGNVAHQSKPPETDELFEYDSDASGCCYFESDGLHLWYARTGLDGVEVQWLDCKTWRVVHRAGIEDDYGVEHALFYPMNSVGRIALCLPAGQDGQEVYWLTAQETEIACELQPLLVDTGHPVFSPSGDEFLAVEGDAVINKYQSSNVRVAGTYRWADFGKEEAGYYLCYVDETTALINSFSGCLFLLDLAAMTILTEVWIEGHEPQPVPFYYTTLSDDGQKCTDIFGMEKFGDTLIFTFCRHQGENISDWQDTLLFAPLTAFRAEEPALEVPVYC